ncbi:MAG: carboxypeptidase regulatory-like domain-containing protein [Planctomycetota bacterium]
MRHPLYFFWLACSAIALVATLSSCSALHAQGDTGFKFLEVKVVGPDGKAISEVAVDVKIDGMEFPMPTDDEGMISLNVPSGDNTRVRLGVKHKELVADPVNWRGAKQIPEEFTIKLEKGIPIGGLVHDTKGNPVEGVKVSAAVPSSSTSGGPVSLQVEDFGTTDSAGRWQVQSKDLPDRQIQLKLSHDDYVSHRSYAPRASWSELKSLDHVLVLEKGIEFPGRVVNTNGEPISDAMIFLGSSRYLGSVDRKKSTGTTGKDGSFRFGNAKPGGTIVTVSAQGWAPELRTVTIERDMDPIEFVLQPGREIRVRVTDPDDLPIAGVGISADEWRGHRSLPEGLYRGKTDQDGIWQSSSMPDEAVKFDLYVRGHMSSRDNQLRPSDETQTIVMQWPLLVTGKVVDAESGLPVEEFNVVQGIDWGPGNSQVHWERYNVKQGRDGKYETEFNEPRAGHYVRIEADGYRPKVSRLLKDEEGEVRINFELEMGSGPSGKILTPDGQPAADVELMVATPNEHIYIYNGHAQQHEGRPTSKSDEQGRYQLPFLESSNSLIVCRHETGYAKLPATQLEVSTDITLVAWSAVEGVVMQGDTPLANEHVQLYFNHRFEQNQPRALWNYSGTTDESGKFRFKRVAGRHATIGRSVRFGDTGQGGFMSAYSHSEPVSLIPGQTVKVQIGGEGQSVSGQLVVPEDSGHDVHWKMASVQVYENPSAQNVGGVFRALGQAIGQLGGHADQQTAQPSFRRAYASEVDESGRFAITDMMPGRYQINVQLYALPTGNNYNWTPIGSLHQPLTIAEKTENEGQDPVDLGELQLKMTKLVPQATAGGGNFILTPVAQ